MAETEHTLRLKATLDTSEVRDEINRLNGSRGGTQSPRGGGGGYPSSQTAVNAVPPMAAHALAALAASATALRGRFDRLGSALVLARGRADSFSKRLNSAKGFLDHFSAALRQAVTWTLRRNMIDEAAARGRQVGFGGGAAGLGYGRGQRLLGFGGGAAGLGYGGGPRLLGYRGNTANFGRGGNGPVIDAEFIYGPDATPPPRNPYYYPPSPGRRRRAEPWNAKQLVRWGLSYAGGTAVRGAGDYLAASKSPYAQGYSEMASAFGGMIQGGAMGAAAGSMAGPHGWIAGAAIGASISAIDSLFDHFTKKARETQEKISSALAVDPTRKANIASAAEMLRALRYERESDSIGQMFEGDLKKAMREASDAVSDIESRIASMDYRDADELQSMLNERQRQMSLRESAASRLDAFRKEDERKAELAKQESKRLEAHGIAIGSLSTGLDRSIESRYHAQRLAAMRFNTLSENEADEAWLGEGYSSYGKRAAAAREAYRETLQKAKSAKTSDEAQKFVELANRQRETWQFLLGRQDFFKEGVLQTLQERLSRISAPDLSNVTSLGQYGYGMGERNDNIDRQMRVWEDQYDVQRQILDVVRDRTFEASYAE